MSWPMSQDFNEAIQNPKLVFNDPDLNTGEAVVGAHGLPLPRSGNFADVYQLKSADGQEWAVKCFTRPVTGLGDRYAAISKALAEANFPFSVGFEFQSEGIRVSGAGRPIVKMEWVEGLLLNQVVRDNASSPKVLTALGQMWVKMCKRLREAGVAHADLQHGNVMLVPGSRPGAYGLKLIDYDGMYVPALANTPSGESGHPSYQHPARAKTRAYSPDVDRFPHLVVATALKGLAVGGQALWEKYDNGDNLLFTEEDFRNPAASKVMRELWWTGQPAVQALVGRLALACVRPIPQTPWLDDLAPEGEPLPLDKETRQAATAALGIGQSSPVATAPGSGVLPPEQLPEVAPPPPSNVGRRPPEVVPAPSSGVSRRSEVAPPPSGVGRRPAEVQQPEPVPARPPKPVAQNLQSITEVELVDDKQAKPRKKDYRRPDQKKSKIKLWMAILGLLVAGGVAAAVVVAGKKPPQPINTAQQPGDEQKGDTTETKGPDPVPPKQKDKTPNPAKSKDPGSETTDLVPASPNANGLTYKERQRYTIPNIRPTHANFDPEGRSLALSSQARRIVVLDPKTGNTRDVRRPGTSAVQVIGAPLGDGRICLGNLADKELTVTDKNGNPAPPIPLPTLPPPTGNEDFGYVFQISANGRYVALSRQGKYSAPTNSAERFPTPLRILDASTGKEVYAADWQCGSVFFNADASRMLVLSHLGRGQWFKLPGGEPDGEWKFGTQGPGGRQFTVLSASQDVKVILGHGWIDERFVRVLISGDTGKTIAVVADGGPLMGYQLSADGKLVMCLARPAMQTTPPEWHLNWFDGTNGKIITQIKLIATSESGMPVFAFAPDGRSAAFFEQKLPINVVIFETDDMGMVTPPKPKDPPKDPPVKDPPVIPSKDPPSIPTGPLDLKARWTMPLSGGKDINRIQVSPDGDLVFLLDGKGVLAVLDGKTGQPHKEFADLTKASSSALFAVGPKRFATVAPRAEDAQLWDDAGKEAGKIVVPDIPPGAGTARGLKAFLSPNGQYLAVGRAGSPTVDNPEVPFRIFDAETKKPLVSVTWKGGSAYFTADSSRVLVAEWAGRMRWFKLPSGEPDGNFDLGTPGSKPHKVYGISADGSAIAYMGPFEAKDTPTRSAVLDGKTGKVTRQFKKHFFASEVSLSGDGKRAAVLFDTEDTWCTFEVVDTATGEPIGRVRIAVKKSIPTVTLSQDGRTLIVYDPDTDRASLFEVPNAGPPG